MLQALLTWTTSVSPLLIALLACISSLPNSSVPPVPRFRDSALDSNACSRCDQLRCVDMLTATRLTGDPFSFRRTPKPGITATHHHRFRLSRVPSIIAPCTLLARSTVRRLASRVKAVRAKLGCPGLWRLLYVSLRGLCSFLHLITHRAAPVRPLGPPG